MNDRFQSVAESHAVSYEKLQERFDGKIEVVRPQIVVPKADPSAFTSAESEMGFRDISARVSELGPLVGRVLLYPSANEGVFKPTVITKRANSMQMTVLDQPFDPAVGISEGMLFALGLKNDTSQPSFGAHTTSRGYEAGHFAPVMLGARSRDVGTSIIEHGDKGTHAVGSEVGGVPEKMIQTGLLNGIRMRTVTLRPDTPRPITLYWHPRLESEDGLMVAGYKGPTDPVRLMLGAANHALGPRALDSIGNLVDASTRGA